MGCNSPFDSQNQFVDDGTSTSSNETTTESTYLHPDKDRKKYKSIHFSNESSSSKSDDYVFRTFAERRPSIPSILIENKTPQDTLLAKIATRSKYYLPILQWIPHYTKDDFFQDLLSGLSLSALFIPQGLSYATALCRIPAIHGLYTISVVTFVYACLGMSPQLSVGPEATVSLIVGSGIAHQQAQQKYPFEPEKAAAIASMTALCVGLFTFTLGLLRFGFLDSLMSRALLRGFITAVGVVVLVQQFIILLGLGTLSSEAGVTPESTTIERLGFLFTHMKNSHLLTTIISICVLTFLFAVPLLKRYILKKEYRFAKVLCQIPEVLLVVIGSVVVCSLGQFNKSGVEILGKVGEGGSDFHLPLPFPTTPYLPSGADIKTVLINAAMITIIGFVESIAAAKSFARRHNYFVSANRELVAIGIGNIIGSFFQAYPAFGSFPRSKVHEQVNPKTQMSGLISGASCVIVTIFLLPTLFYLPTATLSGVIFMAALGLLHELPHDLTFMINCRAWKDLLLMATTFFTTMFFSLELGTAFAVLLSLIITIKQSSSPRITILGRVKETSYEFRPINDSREKVEHLKDVLIVRIEEPLYFANTGQLKDRLRRLEQFGDLAVHPSEIPRRKNLNYIILDIERMEHIDASAVQILHEIIEAYHEQRVRILLVNGHPSAMPLIERAGILELIGPHLLFEDVTDAIQSIEQDMMYTSFPNSPRA